jgi:predicted secreted Zn-dependent protease
MIASTPKRRDDHRRVGINTVRSSPAISLDYPKTFSMNPKTLSFTHSTTVSVRRRALCGILLATWAASSIATPDDVTPPSAVKDYVLHQRVSTYTVTGDDADAVRRSLSGLGPLGSDGSRYDGDTKWAVHWQYGSQSDASGCAVVSSSVVLNVNMTLPQWEHSIYVPEALQRRWSTYLAALRMHEDGHLKNAEMEAAAIAQMLQTIGPQPDCELLNRKLLDHGQQIQQRYKANDAEYDERTGHGRTQGAVFP